MTRSRACGFWAAFVLLVAAPLARSQTTYYFNTALTSDSWDTTTANWSTSASGPYTSLWPNGNSAHFQPSTVGSTVAVNAAVTVNTLTLQGNALTIAAGTGSLTFVGAAPTIQAFSNSTISANIAGTAGLTVTGSRLTLSGSNAGLNAIAASSDTFVRFSSASAIPGASGRTVTVNAAAVVDTAYALDQATLDRIATTSAGVVALNATSSAALNMSAFPTLRLGANGAVTYSGTLTPNGGTWRVGGGYQSSQLTLSGNLTGGNALDVGTNGTVSIAEVVLTGTNTYTGGSVVNGGTLRFNSAAAIAGTGRTVTVNAGGSAAAGYAIDQAFLNRISLVSNGSVLFAASSSNNLDLSGFTGTLSLGRGVNLGTFTYSGTITPAANTYRLGGGGSGSAATFTQPLVDAFGPAPRSLVVNGSGSGGTVQLLGANTFTGETTVARGILQIGNGSVGASLGGPVVLSTSGSTLMLFSPGLAYNGTISGLGIVNVRSGTRLGGTSTHAGTYVDGGSLTLDSGTATGAATGQLQIYNAGTLDLNGYSPQAGFVSVQANGTVTNLAAAPATLTIGNGNSFSSLQGTITQEIGAGAVSLVKNGTGTGMITGVLTYSGGTTINAGTLEVSGTAGSLPGNVATTSSTATFRLNRTNTYTFAGNISGVGRIEQAGTGTTTLSGANTYTGETVVSAGTLVAGSSTAFGTNSAVTVAGGATLDINHFSVAIGSLNGSGTLLNGGGAAGNTLTISDGYFTGSLNIGTAGITKVGSGGSTLAGINNFSGAVRIAAGTLQFATSPFSSGFVSIESGATLLASATIDRDISGTGSDSVIYIGTSGISLGRQSSYNGFNHQGRLSVGAENITLKSAGYAGLGAFTFLSGGVITAPNGVQINGTLVGRGTVAGKVAGTNGSLIEADVGSLTLGDAAAYGGFFHAGELRTNNNTVTLRSLNQATLGSVTTLTGGTLTAANGVYVDFARAVTGTGTITVGSTAATGLTNNGTVAGSGGSLTINGLAKGVGSYSNVVFNGTYSPGLSPALVTVGDIAYGPAARALMEVGGTQRGSQYDAVVSTGNIAFNGTLKIELINGFTPSAGQSFDLFDWQTSSGQFTAFDFPTLPGGLSWDASNLYTTGTVGVVPEPATVFGAAALALAAGRTWRKRATRMR